jgi:hypothetical protein
VGDVKNAAHVVVSFTDQGTLFDLTVKVSIVSEDGECVLGGGLTKDRVLFVVNQAKQFCSSHSLSLMCRGAAVSFRFAASTHSQDHMRWMIDVCALCMRHDGLLSHLR